MKKDYFEPIMEISYLDFERNVLTGSVEVEWDSTWGDDWDPYGGF